MATHWLNTGWGTGGIVVKDGKIMGGAPIFRKLIGRRVDKLPSTYELIALEPSPIVARPSLPADVVLASKSSREDEEALASSETDPDYLS